MHCKQPFHPPESDLDGIAFGKRTVPHAIAGGSGAAHPNGVLSRKREFVFCVFYHLTPVIYADVFTNLIFDDGPVCINRLDDHQKIFYRNVPSAAYVNAGDISERVALRKRLECKSFQWYLDTVVPEMKVPPLDESMVAREQ